MGKFATSGDYNVGGLRTGSDGVLAFDVDVPQDGTYDLSVFANSYNLDGRVKEQGPTNVFLRVDGKDPQELRMPLGYKWVVWGHTDTSVKLTAGKHKITLSAKDTDLGVTKGDAIIDKIDLALRDEHVTQCGDLRSRVRHPHRSPARLHLPRRFGPGRGGSVRGRFRDLLGLLTHRRRVDGVRRPPRGW